MIGRLSGLLVSKDADHVMIDVRGVCYVVYVSERTKSVLPSVGSTISLYTDLLVREDLLQLFGFGSRQEKEWHRALMSVQGVGAKASMAIIGAMGAEGLGRIIALGDWASVRAVKGIGPKIAQRIIMDLKEKAPQIMAMGATLGHDLTHAPDADVDEQESVNVPTPIDPTTTVVAQSDALSALTNLGYSPSDSAAAVAAAVNKNDNADIQELIREALKLLAPGQ
ncbi:MAG: Holliday junction branch migration protein RuvA [Aestuariivita sp.]|nr:Holliday junction branch migration protein RuvA [Aestuariivita sp.]